MSIFSEQHSTLKRAAGIFLILLLCCPALCAPPAEAAQPAQARADYLANPGSYRDNYVLTQLFYSAFSVGDFAAMQQLVSQGLLAYPNDFPHFMAVALELLKTPDSRLFMLLAPLAPYVADPARPADLESAIRFANIIGGRSLPDGGQPEEPSLISRIKFYEDTARVVRRQAPAEEKPPVPGEIRLPGDGQPQSAPAYIAGNGESFAFTPTNGSTVLNWTRSASGGLKRSSRAVDSPLPDGSIWGGVYTNFAGKSETELAFFMVSDGIITFALPKGISEGNFYADETPRPHYTGALNPVALERSPDGAALRPCEMRVLITPRDDAMPPELIMRLEQSNAGPGESDFICRPQCALSYAWGESGYELSGKSCLQGGWGVWPYSDELYNQTPGLPATPAGASSENRTNTKTR